MYLLSRSDEDVDALVDEYLGGAAPSLSSLWLCCRKALLAGFLTKLKLSSLSVESCFFPTPRISGGVLEAMTDELIKALGVTLLGKRSGLCLICLDVLRDGLIGVDVKIVDLKQ